MTSFYKIVAQAFPPASDLQHGIIYEATDRSGTYTIGSQGQPQPAHTRKLTKDEVMKRLFLEVDRLSKSEIGNLCRIVDYFCVKKLSQPEGLFLFFETSSLDPQNQKLQLTYRGHFGDLGSNKDLLTLPNDLKFRIFSYLPLESLRILPLVCKKMRELADDDNRWINQYKQDFGSFPTTGLLETSIPLVA